MVASTPPKRLGQITLDGTLPFSSDVLALGAARLLGYRSCRIATSAGRVHVLSADGGGRLPPVVLIHGFSSTGVHYLPLLRRLRPHVRRLVAPDMPAHGFSDAPPAPGVGPLRAGLFEALDAVLDEPAVLFGDSMGGFAAIQVALARPDRVLGLFLCSPAGAAMGSGDLARFIAQFRLDTHADALAFIDRLLLRPGPLRRLLAWGVRGRFGSPAMEALLASITPDDLLRPEDLRSLRPPALVVWGCRDTISSQEQRAFFRDNLPANAVMVEPERFGHCPFLEDADEVARRIVTFLERVDRRR